MALELYLFFKGNCKEAVAFYADVFGQPTPKIMTFGDVPASEGYLVQEDERDYVMYTDMRIAGTTVMFSDTSKDMPFVAGNNIGLSIVSKDVDEIRSLFGKLKDGGKVDMELQKTFWSSCYGMLTDRFGIPWQFSLDDLHNC